VQLLVGVKLLAYLNAEGFSKARSAESWPKSLIHSLVVTTHI
jgi:hypothetical protein